MKKRRLSDFGDSLFLIVLGVGFFWMTRSPELKDLDNTVRIRSVLTEKPKSGSNDERDYVGFKLAGHKDFFEFTECSYNDNIKKRIEELHVGDSVTIYTNKEKSSTIYPWSGEKYATYRICAASSTMHGTILKFSQYNLCRERIANTFYPLLSGALIIMGLFQIVTKLKANDNMFDTKYLSLDRLNPDDLYFQLQPDKTSFILRNLGGPILSVIIGLVLIVFIDEGTLAIIGYGAIILGIYLSLHYLRIHSKIYYIVDKDGIHIKNISTFFQEEIKTIEYGSIQEVSYVCAAYEYISRVGTVLIYSGKKDDDDEKLYDKMYGIEKYHDVVYFITKMVKKAND